MAAGLNQAAREVTYNSCEERSVCAQSDLVPSLFASTIQGSGGIFKKRTVKTNQTAHPRSLIYVLPFRPS